MITSPYKCPTTFPFTCGGRYRKASAAMQSVPGNAVAGKGLEVAVTNLQEYCNGLKVGQSRTEFELIVACGYNRTVLPLCTSGCCLGTVQIQLIQKMILFLQDDMVQESTDPPSGHSLPYVLVASRVSFLFGYHLGGWIADEFGRRRTFQLCALLMIIGAACSATTRTLTGMLIGRFIVGIGLGIGSLVASLYITEVLPHSVYGTYGSLIQISTCLGLTGTLWMGIPVKSIPGC